MKKIGLFIIFFISFLSFAQNNGSANQRKSTDLKDTIYAPIHAYDGILPDINKRDLYRFPLDIITSKSLIHTDKDTIAIDEDQIKYIRNIYLKKGSTVFYDTIAVKKSTSEPLNGFYKIRTKNGSYNLIMGSFKNGSPFLTENTNPFTYYRSKSIVRKRFFVITDDKKNLKEPLKGYVEDYMLLNPNQWKREIKTWPSEKMFVEDTVYYRKGKMYVSGLQNIYENSRSGNKEWSIGKTHFFDKGNLTRVDIYQYDHNRIKTISSDLTDKNFATLIEDKDDKGNIYKKNNFIYFPQKKCQYVLLDQYYTGVEKGEQCFVPDGHQYEYKGSAERNNAMDVEESLFYDKGLLMKMERKSINKNYTLSDRLTIATYGKSILTWSKESYDYKDQKVIKEYFSEPNHQPVVRIITKYATCISHPLFDSYKCNKSDLSKPAEFKSLIEYYDQSGKQIFKSSYDQNFKGSFEDDINLKFNKK